MTSKWGCCNLTTTNEEDIECMACNKKFHLACINSQDGTHPSTSSLSSWVCPLCDILYNKISKNDNTTISLSSNVRPSKRPALHSPPSESSLISVNEVQNIVQDIVKNEMNDLVTKLHTTISSILCKELRVITDEVKDMKQSIELIHTQVEALHKENSETKAEIGVLQERNKDLQSTVNELESRINTLEQNARTTNLEIQCIPENKNENVQSIILQLGSVIKCDIQSENISHCTRVAKINRNSNRPRSIVVQFNSKKIRDQFLASAINFNKNKIVNNKLNTSHLALKGPSSPIYIVEHLSPSNKALHAAARAVAKEKGYKYVWVRNGRIYVRKSDDSDFIIISDNNSLTKLK